MGFLGSRRLLLASSLLLAARGRTWASDPHSAPAVRDDDGIDSPEMALAELIMGNRRFVAGKRTRTVETQNDPLVRARLSQGQSPFAVVVTCADSRVVDSLVFDQELGRLFTIREAGNSPDLQALASIDYAIEHLHAKLVVVMGHSGCGAVRAVQAAKGKPLPGNLWVFQSAMAGLLETTPPATREDDVAHLARLVEANARRQSQVVMDRSDIVRRGVRGGKVWLLPAVYDLKSGQVRFLERLTGPPSIAEAQPSAPDRPASKTPSHP